MKRSVRSSEKILLLGLGLILLFMILQDWVPLGSLNDVEAIAQVNSRNELILITLINVAQVMLLIGIVLTFIGKTYPVFFKLWLVIHQSSIFVGVLLSWWIPYLLGYGADEKVERYTVMFEDTHTFLPIRNGIVPNTIHVFFHVLLLVCILITIYISVTDRKRTKDFKINSIL